MVSNTMMSMGCDIGPAQHVQQDRLGPRQNLRGLRVVVWQRAAASSASVAPAPAAAVHRTIAGRRHIRLLRFVRRGAVLRSCPQRRGDLRRGRPVHLQPRDARVVRRMRLGHRVHRQRARARGELRQRSVWYLLVRQRRHLRLQQEPDRLARLRMRRLAAAAAVAAAPPVATAVGVAQPAAPAGGSRRRTRRRRRRRRRRRARGRLRSAGSGTGKAPSTA